MHRKLQFMGRVTAGMTHEINNVLAVIRETAGLAQDLASNCGPQDQFIHQERVMRCLQEVQRQIDRGSEATRALNRFAHSVDREMQTLPIRDVIAATMALNDRFARQRNIALENVPTPNGPVIESDLFLVIEILSRLIEQAANALVGGGKVLLSFAPEDTGRTKAVRIWPEKADTAQPSVGGSPFAELKEEMQRSGLSVHAPADPAATGWLFCW